MRYSGTELEIATAQFSKKNVIGQGGFGTVYHGTIRQTSVAVKLLNVVCFHNNIHLCTAKMYFYREELQCFEQQLLLSLKLKLLL